MIKLQLSEKPSELTPGKEKELIDKYNRDGSDVWNKKFIRRAVLEFSLYKCCYSECMLEEESKYMEVDHFFPKKYFPEKIIEWGNLLPSSKKCNATKGEHNTLLEPILNPCIDDPKQHLYIEYFRIYAKTPLGRTTIDITGLNNRKHFANKRARIGLKAMEILEDLHDDAVISTISTSRKKTRYITKIKNLLEQATRENEYSATLSTLILESSKFAAIENFLRDNSLWDDEFNELKSELTFCSLPKP
ncbi:MAG: hypothetical protein KDC42_11145 [Ignavibacteriae bacterium]|nr:hypothetical protein [Ignavibacteriota bacterium]